MWRLAEDIILGEILAKLPPKSLIRLKCVSKYFKTLISSRKFIQRYLCYHSRSSNDDDLLIIPKDGSIICYHLDSSTPAATFTWHEQSSLYVIGSCNGVLCTYLTLLNPTTRVFRDLRSYLPLGANRGFAFDPVNLDFKIVGFSDIRNYAAAITYSRITKVYSLNANSCTTLETKFPTDSVVEGRDRRGIVINYYLVHWMFSSLSLGKCKIGCFDVCKMKWTDVLLPRYYYDPTRRNYLLDIGVLDSLLWSSFENKVDSCFDVWVMMEYGFQDSWFKLFSIPISDNLREGVIPIASRNRSAEVLIRQRHNSKFYWYDRADGRMNEANFDGVPDFWRFESHMCSRSMVDLPGGRLFDDR